MDVARELDCASIEERDLVSRYLAEKLPSEEAEAFEKHYFGCDRCWEELQAATEVRAVSSEGRGREKASQAEIPRRRGPVWTNWRVLSLAAVVAVAVAAGLISLRLRRFSPIASLVAGVGEWRPVEARLAGDFEYAKPDPITRGPGDREKDVERVERQVRRLERMQDRGPEEERALGLGYLVLGNFESAIETLRKASQRFPGDAKVWSDLSAAYYSRSPFQEQPRADLEESYRTARRAVDLDPSLTPARFNLALVLQKLHFREEANREWKAYLDLDSKSGWAAEARNHVRELSTPPSSRLWESERGRLETAERRGDETALIQLAKKFPVACRIHVEDELLPRWAASDPSDPFSKDFSAARVFARAVLRETGDRFLVDSIETMENVFRSAPDAVRIADLREGHRLYGEGRKAFLAKEPDRAGPLFEEAARLLRRAGTAFELLAASQASVCLFYRNEIGAALSRALKVAARAREFYPSLFGHAQWLAGLCHISLGRPIESVAAYRSAAQAFERSRDLESAGAVHSLLAEDFEYLGRESEAAAHRHKALALLAQTGTPRRLINALNELALSANENGLPEIALLASSSAAESARESNDPSALCDSLLQKATAEAGLGLATKASRTLAEAVGLVGSIRDSFTREKMAAEAERRRSLIERSAPNRDSLEGLSASIAFFTKRGDVGRLPEYYLERGKRHRAEGNPREATLDFLAGIAVLEGQREALEAGNSRLLFFDRSEELFDQAVALLARDGEASAAADLVERSRARSLLDTVGTLPWAANPGTRPVSPLSEKSLRRRLPPRTSVVLYAVLENELLIFVLRSSGLRLKRVPARRRDLETMSGRFWSLSQGSTETRSRFRAHAQELHRSLIAPIADDLQGSETVVFIPDKGLHRVPFAALLDPKTARYLVEEYAVAIAPSASIYAASLDRDRGLSQGAAGGVLVVADPRFEAKFFPGLRRLPQARAEADVVSALYPKSRTLRAESATKRVFLREAAAASVIHFAGHALAETNPLLSTLVLAPEPAAGDSGLLYARDISALELPATRLVVLAACDTAGGPASGTEGVLSLARAFLTAGVPAVVGTLAPVEDRAAAILLTAFHRRLAAGDDPVSALRAAQLSQIAGPEEFRDPASWSAFQLIGGSADS